MLREISIVEARAAVSSDDEGHVIRVPCHAASDSPRRIYVSGQKTKMVSDLLSKLSCQRRDVEIRASNPPANRGESDVVIWNLDAPCYGYKVENAVADLGTLIGDRFPLRYKVDQFAIEKFLETRDMALKALQAVGLGGDPYNLLVRTYDWFESKEPEKIKNWDSWSKEMLKLGWPQNFADRLHYADVLVMMGADLEQSMLIRERDFWRTRNGLDTTYSFEAVPDAEHLHLEGFFVRWLSKALCGFRLGCIADVVNLCFAMMNRDTRDVKEDQIVSTIGQLTVQIIMDQLDHVWIPDGVIQDAEDDDQAACMVIGYVRAQRNLKAAKIWVQLPTTRETVMDNKSVMADFKMEGLIFMMHGANVFFDQDSKNARALVRKFLS